MADDHASWGLAEGDRIGGRHRVLRALGGGRRTEVYLALDEPVGAPVVVKVLRPGQGDGARRALAAEAELAASLTHPAFPRLVAADLDAAPPHLVLERLRGPRLSTVVRTRGPLAVAAAVRLGRHLADAVGHLHGRGYVHLDVKPSNTILADAPYLVDLGVARPVAAAAATRGTVGTHRFQSPEQHDVAAFGGLSPKADVWGVAITVLTALRGSSPFGPLRDDHGERRRLTPDDVAAMPFPPELPRDLHEALRVGLAWSPGDRPTAAELAESLRPLSVLPR